MHQKVSITIRGKEVEAYARNLHDMYPEYSSDGENWVRANADEDEIVAEFASQLVSEEDVQEHIQGFVLRIIERLATLSEGEAVKVVRTGGFFAVVVESFDCVVPVDKILEASEGIIGAKEG